MPVTFASTILLPDDCESWPELKQRAAMSHEKSHIERNDFYWLLLAALYRALFWFNPLAWQLARRLGELMEMLSDDAAIEDLGDAPAYAEILLDVARNVRPTRTAIAMAQSRTMAWRIDRVLRAAAISERPSAGKRLLVVASVLPLVALSAINIVHGAAAGAEEHAVVGAQAAPPSGPAPAENAESTLDHVFARNGLVLTISREGARLFAQLTGQPKARIYSHSESEFFFATAIDAWISFRTDGQLADLSPQRTRQRSKARRCSRSAGRRGCLPAAAHRDRGTRSGSNT
jgi:hypothetical protein